MLVFSSTVAAQEANPPDPSGSSVPSGASGAVIVPPKVEGSKASPITPPRLVMFAHPQYPESARAAGTQGTVVLKLDIDREGHVTKTEISQPGGNGFDEAATAAAPRLVFEPARRSDGTTVGSRILFRYNFTLDPPAVKSGAQALGGLVLGPDEKPVPAAKVRGRCADGSLRETTSDATGRFVLEGIPPGAVELTIDAHGFEIASGKEETHLGETLEITYRLRRPATTLPAGAVEEVTVRGDRPAREVTRRTLTRREIDRIPGTNGDALRSLQNLPGVARPPAIAGLLIVRGSAPQDSQTFVDGTSIPLTYHFGGLSSVVPTQLLEKIDFYPGNFSARYGHGMGGIVDVGLRSPKSDGRLHGLGQIDLIDGRLMAEGPVPLAKGWSFLAAGRRSWIDVTLGPILRSGGVTQAPVYYDYQFMVETRPDDHSRLRFAFFGSDDSFKAETTDVGGDAAVSGNLGLHTAFTRFQASYQNSFSPNDRLSWTLSVGGTNQDFAAGSFFFLNGSTDAAQRLELMHRFAPWLGLNVGSDVAAGSYSVRARGPSQTAPGDADNQPFSSRPALEIVRSGTYTRPAAYAELEVTPSDRLRIVPGARVDYDKGSGSLDASPRVNARYDVVHDYPRTTMKGGVGLFYQPPQFQEVTPPLGTPGLKSNRAVHYGVGVEQEITRHIEGSIEGFYKDLDRLVVGSSKNGYANVGTGRAFGVEVLLKYNPDAKFFGWLAYTLSRSTRTDKPGEDEHLASFDQTHIFTILGSYRLGKGWEVGGRFRLISGNLTTASICNPGGANCDATRINSLYYAPSGTYVALPYGAQNGERLPMFHQFDIRADKKWQFDGWSLATYLDLQNVYNHRSAEGITYNFNYTSRDYVLGLPIIPSLGLRGEF